MKSIKNIALRKIIVIIFLYLTFFAFITAFAVSEAEDKNKSTETSEAELSKEEVYRILPGDTLKITIYNDEELSAGVERLVGEDGLITIPYVDVSVKVLGMSKEECKQEIRKRLIEEEMYTEPNLDVAISKFGERTVQVTGLVEKTGEIAFDEGKPMTIDEAIAKAGGFSRDKRAARNKVKLTRTGKNGKKLTFPEVRVDDIMKGKEKPFYLQPGDIIEVTESLF